jgi:hypothetical protein
MTIKADVSWKPYVPEREYLGVWDVKAKWWFDSAHLKRHQWLVDNIVGPGDLDYIYRVEFYVNHSNGEDYYTATIYRFAKNADGKRYIIRDDQGNPIVDDNGSSRAALVPATEFALKGEVPEELR